jgi:hypothetical protein
MDLAGKFMGWFNKGMNTQIPNEATAAFGDIRDLWRPVDQVDPRTLIGNDRIQRGQSNINFQQGRAPSALGRPDRAVLGIDFPESLKTHRVVTVPGSEGGPGSAPTGLVREAIKRPLRALAGVGRVGGGLGSMILGDLINPRPLASGTLDDHIQYLQPGGLGVPNSTYGTN